MDPLQLSILRTYCDVTMPSKRALNMKTGMKKPKGGVGEWETERKASRQRVKEVEIPSTQLIHRESDAGQAKGLR